MLTVSSGRETLYNICELSTLVGTASSSLVTRKEKLVGDSSMGHKKRHLLQTGPFVCAMFFEIQFYRVGFCIC